ncbi:MAG TPA: fused response regulator/phosphatase [Treponema sp.]|nr:fused response regulator/phosphatase [Treponema sp.]
MNDRLEMVLVDDEFRVTDALVREIRLIFGNDTFAIKSFNDPVAAAEYIASHGDSIFLVISDLRMPVMSGSELLTFVRETSSQIQTILLTAYTDIEDIQKAISASIQSLLFKPWTRESLKAEITKALNLWNIQNENRILSQRIESMLKEAGEFQKNLFASNLPDMEQLHIELSFLPLETYHCGGDFFEFRQLDESHVFVILGDVSGHGLKSAIIAVMLKTAMDEMIKGNPARLYKPDTLVSTLNNYFCSLLKSAPEVLVGFAAMVIDTKEGKYSIASAGIPSIIHIHQHVPELIISSNPVLGAFVDAQFLQIERNYREGDQLFLFTDGLIESVPHFFSMKDESIIDLINKYREQPIETIVAAFRSSLPGGKFTDDVTLISMHLSSEK